MSHEKEIELAMNSGFEVVEEIAGLVPVYSKNGCTECVFCRKDCDNIACTPDERADGMDVIFVRKVND